MRPWPALGAHPARRVRPTPSLGKASTDGRAVAFASPPPSSRSDWSSKTRHRLAAASVERAARLHGAACTGPRVSHSRARLDARLHLLRSCGQARASGDLFSTPGLDEWRPSDSPVGSRLLSRNRQRPMATVAVNS
jgi:hypothetical protein